MGMVFIELLGAYIFTGWNEYEKNHSIELWGKTLKWFIWIVVFSDKAEFYKTVHFGGMGSKLENPALQTHFPFYILSPYFIAIYLATKILIPTSCISLSLWSRSPKLAPKEMLFGLQNVCQKL